MRAFEPRILNWQYRVNEKRGEPLHSPRFLWRLLSRRSPFCSAAQLKKLREARDLSQERLGELCNFERQYVGRIERGERVISFEGMMRIAFNLQVRPADLYKQVPIPNRMPKKGEYKGQKKSGTKKAPL